ncbi:MAG TPA: hypothetical protein PLA90_17430 [Candidatus Sumerlaeota bacterium]|nr:hypothetical protein [Candidatus Sumerlaeota bacterium]
MPDSTSQSLIQYAQLPDDVVVVRVIGRGDHRLSLALKTLGDQFKRPNYSPRFLFDIRDCTALDSTFMGILAALALHQKSSRQERTVLVNANPTTERQLTTLGLNYLLDIRAGGANGILQTPVQFQNAETAATESRFQQIVHMIEAHQTLVDISSGNEVLFRHVLDSLQESAEHEKSSNIG